jgi:exopolysaccharide production protein ExoY
LRQLGERDIDTAAPAEPRAIRAAPPVPPVPEASAPATSRGKRALDLVLVLGTAPLTMSLGLLTAVLVKLTSRGPVLFGQERVGLGGERFTMYKFRTMHRDAERLLQQDPGLWNDYVTNGYKVPAELDRRITPLGRFLRRSSLDELPQIINVLTGQMSLVGPRPVVPEEVENYGDQRTIYLSVRPGITGAWQVNGRSTVDYPDRVDIDADYVSSWSVWLDVKILVKTPIAVLSTRGAF